MKMKYKISTSNIDSVEWEDGLLTVVFENGNTSEYSNVPSGLAEGMYSAASSGSYFNRHISGKYSYVSKPGDAVKAELAKQIHHIDFTVGLWATDRPDLIPADLKKEVFFQIDY